MRWCCLVLDIQRSNIGASIPDNFKNMVIEESLKKIADCSTLLWETKLQFMSLTHTMFLNNFM